MAIPWQDHLIPDGASQDLSNYVEDEARITATTSFLKPIGPSIWMVTAASSSTIDNCHEDPPSQSSSPSQSPSQLQLHQPATIIVGLQGAGGAWVWNPQIGWNQQLGTEIQARCGAVRHLVVPNKHYMATAKTATMPSHLQDWSKAYPQAKVYAPPDFEIDGDESSSTMRDLTIDFLLTDDPKHDYVLDMDQVLFRGSSTVEAVFFHRASETVLFGDLLMRTDNNHHHHHQEDKDQDQNQNQNQEDGGGGSHPHPHQHQVVVVPPIAPSRPSSIKLFWSLLSRVEPLLLAWQEDDSQSSSNTSSTESSSPSPSQPLEYATPCSWRWSYWWYGEHELARKALDVILKKWKPRQIVLATSPVVVEEYAMDVLEQAFAWVPKEGIVPPTHVPFDRSLLGNMRRGTYSTGGSVINKDVPRVAVPTPETQSDSEVEVESVE